MQKEELKSLPGKITWLYSLGDIATSAPLSFIAFFQLIFLTDVAGLRPDLAGYAVLIGKIWDGFNDPIFGYVSERIKHKMGRRRVVLLWAAVPFGISFFLQFISIGWDSQLSMMLFYAGTIIVFDTIYTTIHISYNALTPAITSDYDLQSTLNGYRMAYSIFGTLISIIIATLIGKVVVDPRTRYQLLGAMIGAMAVLPIFVVYAVTEEYDSPEAPETDEKVTLRESISSALSSKPFRYLILLYLFSWTTASLVASVLVFFANYYLQLPEQANYFVLVSQTSAILFIPFWVWMAQKFDKRRSFIWGSISWAIIMVFLAMAQPSQVVLVYILATLSGAGIATAYFLPWAMIPDIVDYDELMNGQRREGIFYAFISFFQKLGTGLAIWAFGVSLAAFGYISPEAGSTILPVQPESAVTAIRLAMGLVPAILLTFAIIFAYFYPIDRTMFEDIRRKLTIKNSIGKEPAATD